MKMALRVKKLENHLEILVRTVPVLCKFLMELQPRKGPAQVPPLEVNIHLKLAYFSIM